MDGLAFLIAVVSFVMALVALNKISRLQTALFKLRQETEALKAPAAPEAVRPVEPETAAPALPEGAAPAAASPPQSRAWGGPAAASDDRPRPVTPPRPSRDMEQALAGRWFVWIGGVAIAVGGLLFAKYAYDSGLIPPALQVALGLAAGLLLVAAGEWVRRRAPTGGGAPDHVPAALSSAGLAVLFGTIYAGYALYQLFTALTGFLGLAAVGLGGLALSRRQGPFIAALGLLGSYVAPALIPSPDPLAWGFFPYLLVILAASLLTLRGRNWWWLGHGAIAGVVIWSVLWLNGPFANPDSLPLGLAALLTGLAAMLLPASRDSLSEDAREPPQPVSLRGATGVGVAGLAAAVVVLVLLVLRTHHASLALWLLATGLAMLVLFAWRRQGLRHLAPAAALVMLAVLASWREVAFHARTLDEYGRWSWSNAIGPEAERYLDWMLGAGAAFMLAGIAGVLARPHKRVWGGLGGGAGFLFLFGAWARADFMLADLTWALLAAGTAATLLAATLWWSRRPSGGDDEGAGLLALAAAALLVMALARLLDGIWLTLAIAGLAAGYAVLSGPLKPRLMGPITAGLAGLTALRLFVSRDLWWDDRSLPWGEHWVIYGYGLPALLFWAASRLLRRRAHDGSAVALEGISLGLMISLLALETRVLIAGGIGYEKPQFLEVSAHVLTWAGAAYGLMHRQGMFSTLVSRWGARLLLTMAAAAAVGLNLLALNPVVTGDPVPGGPFFNALFLAYLAPVPLVLLISRRLGAIGWERFRPLALGLALLLLFAWVTLETKRLFQGMMLTPWPQSLDENYAYSAVWLILALALFVTGIRLGRQQVRLAGLGVLALVVLKVFLGDMSNLEGLLRIASFVGLGLCLVGIGWLYQHFVRGTEAAAPHRE